MCIVLSQCRDRIPGSPRRIVSLTRRQPPLGVNDSSGFRSYAEIPSLTAPDSRDGDACATYVICGVTYCAVVRYKTNYRLDNEKQENIVLQEHCR